MQKNQMRCRGFTLIELLVVMAIIASLITLVLPSYSRSIDKARESVLLQQLMTMRKALDHYFEDAGRYPDSLQDLVAERYLRTLPKDPITGSTKTWVALPPKADNLGGVYDVTSGAPGHAADGSLYREW